MIIVIVIVLIISKIIAVMAPVLVSPDEETQCCDVLGYGVGPAI